jgi:hypothetical protein
MVVARQPASWLPMRGARRAAPQRKWPATYGVFPTWWGRSAAACGGRRGLVASAAWRLVSWVEKTVVGLLRTVTWAVVACWWESVLGANHSRTKCQGWVWSPEAAPEASLVVDYGGWQPRPTSRSCVDLSRGLSAAEVRWCAARCRWWLAAAAGYFHPSASSSEDLGSSSRCWSSHELGKMLWFSCRWSSVWLRGA